jgi:hypothetical protein
MKKFFNSMEERFVFPIGRKSWQILSLLGLVILALSIVYFILNSTPTSRDSVSVSKSEVIGNKLDTNVVSKVEVTSGCTTESYNQWMDTLKKDLPNSEWNNLGDSSESTLEYVLDENGNMVMDENGNYQTAFKKIFKPNPAAIPNVLNEVFAKSGYDSSSVCQKIEVIKILHYLNKKIEPSYLAKEGFFYNAYFIEKEGVFTMSKLEQSFVLINLIESNNGLIQDQKALLTTWKYINFTVANNITQAQIDLASNLIKAHKGLSTKVFPSNNYFELVKLIFSSDLKEQDLSAAMNGFTADISYYDNNDLYKSLRKYLKLYQEKVAIAEEKKSMKMMEKSLNRVKSLTFAGGAFISIVAIASILLLFSIQSLLKNYLNNKN